MNIDILLPTIVTPTSKKQNITSTDISSMTIPWQRRCPTNSKSTPSISIHIEYSNIIQIATS